MSENNETKEVKVKRSSNVSTTNVEFNPMPEVKDVVVDTHRIKKTSLAISITSEYNRSSKTFVPIVREESVLQTIWQIFVPFFIASIGSIGAGIILNRVENSHVFQNVGALYVCTPALMGLKGNLDTCLAARLSTQANLGNMSNRQALISMTFGNIGTVQIQAIVAAVFISMYAIGLNAIISSGSITVNSVLVVAASAPLTASLSCLTLDFALVCVIYFGKKYNINPDNICAPLVASIGDVISIGLLALFAHLFYNVLQKGYIWIPCLVIAVYVCLLLPSWIIAVRKNPYASSVLKEGWIPVFSAIVISGLGGLLLNQAVAVFSGFSAFQPVVNGVGGDIVSIHTSRIATFLHQTATKGRFPPVTRPCVAPWTALFHGVFSAKTARLLIPIALTGQSVYVFVADVIQNYGKVAVTPVFFFSYILAVAVQIMLLLYIAHLLTHALWRYKMDPDSTAVPYLTATSDLMGTAVVKRVKAVKRVNSSDLLLFSRRFVGI